MRRHPLVFGLDLSAHGAATKKLNNIQSELKIIKKSLSDVFLETTQVKKIMIEIFRLQIFLDENLRTENIDRP